MKLYLFFATISFFQPFNNDCLRGYYADAKYELENGLPEQAIITYQEAIQNCQLNSEKQKEVLIKIDSIYATFREKIERQRQSAITAEKKAKANEEIATIALFESEARQLAAASIRAKEKWTSLELAYKAKSLMDSSKAELPSVLLGFGKAVRDSFLKTYSFEEGIISDCLMSGDKIILAKGKELIFIEGGAIRKIGAHNNYILELAFLEDKITSISKDGQLKIWNKKGQIIATRQLHSGKINFLQVDTLHKQLLTGGNDYFAFLLDENGNKIREMKHDSRVLAGQFSVNKNSILTRTIGNKVYIWYDSTSTSIPSNSHIYDAAFLSEFIITVDAAGMVKKYNQSGTLVSMFEQPNIPAIALKVDKNSLNYIAVFADGSAILGNNYSDSLLLFQANSIHSALLPFNRVAFSPKDDLFINIVNDSLKYIRKDGTLLKKIGQDVPIIQTSFSPDGQKIMTITNDFSVIVYNLKGSILLEITDFQSPVLGAKFSEDNQYIIAYSKQGKLITCPLPSKIYQHLNKKIKIRNQPR